MSIFSYLRLTLKSCVILLSGIHVFVASHFMVNWTEILEDKALYGYAFHNFTMKTNTVNECFFYCYEDCFCMTFQISQNTECQLLSSNRFQTPSALVTMKGYSYYDMVSRKTHRVDQTSPALCTPRCECRVNPCENGGSCESFFPTNYTTPRFKCNCLPGYAGDFCENVVKSCRGYINGSRISGKYEVSDDNMNLFEVFCDFDSNSTMAWTLVQSYQFKNKESFMRYSFSVNYSVNEDSPRWDEYRLSKSRMQSIKEDSRKWRITCKYDTDGVVYRDYLQATNDQVDIMTFDDGASCSSVEWINTRGQSCKQCTTFLIQLENSRALHADSYHYNLGGNNVCDFQPTGSKYCDGTGEDNFGLYECFNSAHRCSSSQSATTQTWFGGQ